MAQENLVTELPGRNVLTGSWWDHYNDSNLPSLSLSLLFESLLAGVLTARY